MHDLLVVGAGPAGLATALYANAAGLDTIVVEPRRAPIDKACGEGLMPPAVGGLRELGVPLDGHPIRGIRYLDRRTSAESRFDGTHGLGVRRTTLHEAMHHEARERGIPIVQGRVDSIRQDQSGVHAADHTARYLAAADGLHSPIRRMLHLEQPSPNSGRRWGQRQHFVVPPWTDLVEVYWSERAEAYVTPVGDSLVGVAILSTVQRPFAQQLADFPALVERLPDAAASGVRGAGPMRQRVRSRVSGRVLLVGDAAGYVDALTGEGIAISLRCARALVTCVANDDPERYEREWLRESRRYRLLTSSLLWASRRRALRPTLVPLAARAPWFFDTCVRQISH